MHRLSQVIELIESTGDAAFVVEVCGGVVGWNKPAEKLLGIPRSAAVGRQCWEMVRGTDECGPLCSEDCIVMQAARKRRAVQNFDMQLPGAPGKPWCNFYILFASGERSNTCYIIHLIRDVDLRKRLELVLRDFVVRRTHLSAEAMQLLLSVSRTPAKATQLTPREQQIVGLLATGLTARQIASQLRISHVTVNNHVQHLMKKLSARSRLEAIRRAERAGLI
jgi:DNA-binding CsgD family transcriptional regulator